ncbi:MAG: alkaline phosphatase family protein [archaeon]
MKVLLVVLDGAAGRSHPLLKGKSELEAASKPKLDMLCYNGTIGLLEVVPNVAPESDIAVLSLLGFDLKNYPGRGPLEALGAFQKLSKKGIALRANFCTVEGETIVDRRVGRGLLTAEAKALEKSLNEIELSYGKAIFKATAGHRGVLVLEGSSFSPNVSNTDPAYVRKNNFSEAKESFSPKIQLCEPLEKKATLTARIINEWLSQARDILENHPINLARIKRGALPANYILLRDAGSLNINKKRYLPGIKKAILADMPLEVGIGKFLGFDVINIPEGFTKAKYVRSANACAKALSKYDFVYVHIKGPDVFGHDKDVFGKVKCIENIDRFFFAPLLRKIDFKKVVLCVTCDHATPAKVGAHTSDPVPILFYGAGIPFGFNTCFCERNAVLGPLRLRGEHLIEIINKNLRKSNR